MKMVVLGLSLSSSWGNGHATTYRALLKALAHRGHEILFLERDVSWYAVHRDLLKPDYCCLRFYQEPADLRHYTREIETAEIVIIGSFVPDGIEIADWALPLARGMTAFYDIDTPATFSAIRDGTCAYLAARQIPKFDLYLSFTGGPLLRQIEQTFAARAARALYCAVDTEICRPLELDPLWDIGYLGTYSADRQPALEKFLIEPALRSPDKSFVVAGAQYPETVLWPSNVHRIDHIAPDGLPEFFAKIRWALNITRSEMIDAGFSPSVRLFEAAACGAPIISDRWRGLEKLFSVGEEIILADDTTDVLAALSLPETRRLAIAAAARTQILSAHSAEHRAAELETIIAEIRTVKLHSANIDRELAAWNRSAAIRL
ncbi:MAG: glycosyltransferase [Hyphomicrobium sp.]|nr:glycosyltransferase [Hyphomicrobium sp.]